MGFKARMDSSPVHFCRLCVHVIIPGAISGCRDKLVHVYFHDFGGIFKSCSHELHLSRTILEV